MIAKTKSVTIAKRGSKQRLLSLPSQAGKCFVCVIAAKALEAVATKATPVPKGETKASI